MKQRKSIKKASTGLAGALAIAGGTSAYGAIVNAVIPADSTIAAGATTVNINWDVNGDGVIDFQFQNRFPPAGGTGVAWQVNMNPTAGNAVLGYGAGATYRYGSAFVAGTSIGPTAPVGTPFQTTAQIILGSVFSGVPYGGLANPSAPGGGGVNPGTLGYIGFRFAAGANTLFGWIRMSGGPGMIDFNSASYQNVTNTAIPAGATAVPEPSTLAGLAMGAAMLGGAALRRRRAA